MNKEEIKAVLAIIKRQSFVGVNREAIENNLEYRLLCSAATKLERMLLDIESGYNKLVKAGYSRKGAGMTVGELRACLSDVPDDLPVRVTYDGGVIQGTMLVRAAFEDVLWDDETIAGEELECFCIAVKKVEELELFERTKVRGSEDGKDAGRGRYHAVYNQARDCWDLMFRDVLCASFYVGRYPCAEDKVVAEVSRLNAEYGKEGHE